MPINCPNYKESVLAQTLFLGASVISFSSNVGWGGKSSSLTVELIEDFQPSIFSNIPHYNPSSYPLNHYYNCNGDDCYVDELGIPYTSSSTKKEKNAPGKLYYRWVGNNFVSDYWINEDPGFLATGSYIQPDGSVNKNGPINIYDIIDTPVYFKFDNFEFIGLVKSWERNNRPGGMTYSVQIESFDSLLDNCKIILQDFDGPITSIPNGRLSQGNVANIFNVYGFLESMGYNRFGGAALNDNGISAKSIIDSLHALTANLGPSNRPEDSLYSPFGRILSKSIKRVGINYNTVNENHITTMNSFGVICSNAPSRGFNRSIYNSFSLDLSSLPSPPYDYRISGSPDESISGFISKIIEDTGLDYLSVVVPVKTNDGIEFVIKIITVNRTQYNPTYQIPATVSALESSGLNIESSSFGQEANQNNIRKVVFGGNQQRFYQAKTYRLAYAQNNYIWNPIIKKFVNNRRSISKVRNPSLRSTRIDNITIDPYWGDKEIGRPESVIGGNYFLTRIFRNNPGTRFIPLFRDIICPYFGTKMDVTYGSTSDSNIFRFVRPVYLDSWTNQIVIGFGINELPSLSIGEPLSLYDGGVAANNENEEASSSATTQETDNENSTEKDSENEQVGTEESEESTEDSPPQQPSPFGPGVDVPLPGGDSDSGGALDRLEPRDPAEDRNIEPDGGIITVPEFRVSSLPSESSSQNITTFTPFFNSQQEEESETPSSDSPQFEPGIDSDDEPETSNEGQDNKNSNAQKRDEDVESENGGSESSEETVTPAAKSDRNVVRTLEYKAAGFTIKETELRCAGFDQYLTYCLGKSYFSKPDLFVMLVNAYKAKGIFLEAKPPPLPGEPIDAIGVGGGFQSATNQMGNQSVAEDGQLAEPRQGLNSKMQMNWDLYLNHNFIKDLQAIYAFISNISSKYYGKQYMVKLPDVYAYKDTSYLDIAIPGTTSSFFVYHGSQNIRYNFEIADGAWEEPGNYIDDTFVFGDNYWHALRNDDGLLGPILGYNISANVDDVTCLWGSLDNNTKKAIIKKFTKVEGVDRSNYAANQNIRNIQQKIDGLKNTIRVIQSKIDKKNNPKTEDAKK